MTNYSKPSSESRLLEHLAVAQANDRWLTVAEMSLLLNRTESWTQQILEELYDEGKVLKQFNGLRHSYKLKG